jgi:hypothetical protein
MPGPTIDQTFITKFNNDMHLTYRQGMSKYRGLVRTDASVKAETCRFYKLGAVTASSKARNGDIPVSNPAHSYVTATMSDRYIALLLDELDLTKLSVDVRSSYVKAGASAFAMDTDQFIVDAMTTGATVTQGTYSGNLTRNVVLQAAGTLDAAEVPRDGRRFWGVSPVQWEFLMSIDQFVRADYTGPEDLPFKKQGNSMRTWNDFHFFVSNRLPGTGTSQCKSYCWHMDSVGHGINADIATSWDWENLKRSWSMSGSMSMGAVVIDATGLIEVRLDDTAALP